LAFQPFGFTNPNPKVGKSGAVGEAVLAQDPGFDGTKPRAPRFISIVHEVKRLVALSCLDIYLPACPEAAPSVTRHGALQTDRQLKPPRRRGSLASREGEVRHKK